MSENVTEDGPSIWAPPCGRQIPSPWLWPDQTCLLGLFESLCFSLSSLICHAVFQINKWIKKKNWGLFNFGLLPSIWWECIGNLWEVPRLFVCLFSFKFKNRERLSSHPSTGAGARSWTLYSDLPHKAEKIQLVEPLSLTTGICLCGKLKWGYWARNWACVDWYVDKELDNCMEHLFLDFKLSWSKLWVLFIIFFSSLYFGEIWNKALDLWIYTLRNGGYYK